MRTLGRRPAPAGKMMATLPVSTRVAAGGALVLLLSSGCGSVDESHGLIGSRSNAPVVINELMSANDLYYPDSQGNTPDWIELFNLGEEAVNLSGYFLSDNPDNPMKARLSDAVVVPAGGVIVIRANKNDQSGDPLTVDLGLNALGDSVILTDALGLTVDSVTFGAPGGVSSLARHPDGTGPLDWCDAPTPDELNGSVCPS